MDETSTLVSGKRLSFLIIVLCALVLSIAPVSAQETDQPKFLDTAYVAPRPIKTDYWAVRLAPGVDPNAVAAANGFINLGPIADFSDQYLFQATGNLRATPRQATNALRATAGVLRAKRQKIKPRFTRQSFTDPLYPNQWHLRNTGQGGGTSGEDVNILNAWNAGYNGTGVVVSSVDDGVWTNSPDLIPNYLASASWDFVGGDSNPSGGAHGTSVAGVMAASENTECGVGAAYNAQVSGIRLLGNQTDANEASALTYQYNTNHIYNNSWGPADDGKVLEQPGSLTRQALINGTTNGRGGKGAIYVWAAGNGGTTDNVNADGYANSIYTIAVGATTNTGVRSSYSEPGAAMFINAPSNGGSLAITTTDGPGSSGYGSGNCTSGFGGTSSASPLAAGVIALMLDANPNLTWRDVQHILARTAEKNNPTNSDWRVNAAGYNINHNFGFGRIDATAAVNRSLTWTTVPAKTTFTSPSQTVGVNIPDGPSGAAVTRTLNVTNNLYLEHVEIVFNASHTWRGDVEVTLTSPSGTVSKMIYGRINDSNDNYNNWRMMSVRHWGELSAGTWTISVRDTARYDTGRFNSWQLILHGTTAAPPSRSAIGMDSNGIGTEGLLPLPPAPGSN